ncbi:MAG TPA: hypothetical protein VGG09_14785 [Acidimicrobiales bacterium]
MEMEDETDGETTRPVLEQVVESVTIPSQLLLVADAESLVGTPDDPFGSGLFDHDSLDG